jgi:photosystem II stability/assembly factor-like uncharacterized protein
MLRKKDGLVAPLSAMITVTFLLSFWSVASAYAQEVSPELWSELEYRHIGPVGNRVTSVVGIPGDHRIYYIGAASGGIFKSTDGGIKWDPIFDGEPVSSIGSLAIAPSDPNIVWAGTGEAYIRSNISQGTGIYKSTDAGKTWKHMGLDKTGRIGRVIIDPRDPDIVFAAAMGHCYGPQQERGIFRTTDGGENWERVLFVDEDTGASDLAMDPNNPRILFAGMWPMSIKTWGRWSGGPSGGLHVSRDGGTTWKEITGSGLPEGTIGRVAVAIAPSDSNRIYALIETEDEGLWRSDDGGETWKHVNHDHSLLNRPHYYTRCIVAPNDADEVYFPATRFHMTLDGGETIKRFDPIGGDHHDMWIDPTMPDRMMVGNDDGVSISINGGQSWIGGRLPIAQMYHVSVDNQVPYYVYGNKQDGPSYRGPSNSLTSDGISSGMWHSVGGCESGHAVPDPVENNIIWSGCYDGLLGRYDLKTGHTRPVTVWPESIQFWEAAEAKYRFQWTFPIAISPHNHEKVYVGSQYVHQTTDGGHSWTVISPDLSTNDVTKQQRAGGLTPDDDYYGCAVFAIAESSIEEGLIWTGTNDGLVQLTRDGGANWTNVTGNIPDLPEWGTVSNIEPSRYDAGTCYFTMDFHQVNNRDPYVYKTTDYGESWKRISSDIPKSELSYAHCVREDPVRKGQLYLGTENALYASLNDGENWLPLQNNLPPAPVHWLVIQEHFNDLVVGTYGRGFWIMDDVSPLQQLTAEVLESEAHLFELRPAYRFRNIEAPESHPNDQCIGENPTYGASINYYLKTEPEEEVVVTILDENNQVVRTLSSDKTEDDEDGDNRDGASGKAKVTKNPGINRVWWDLRYEQMTEVKLRTSPVDAPYIEIESKGWRSLGRGTRTGPLVAPGAYTVKLSVGDQEFNQPLTVKKDPHSAGSEADIRAQVRILLEIRDNINSVVDMINQIEWLRKQVEDLRALSSENEADDSLSKAVEEFEVKLIDMQDHFYNVRLTYNSDQRWRERFYTRYCHLASGIGESDFPPTTQQVEVHGVFKERLESFQSQFNELLNKDLLDFNHMLEEKSLPKIWVISRNQP